MNFVINGFRWDVVFVSSNSPKLHRSDGSLTVGVTDWADKTVYLSSSITGAFLRKVFIHEVSHCAVFSYGIEISLEQEEFLCDFIATFGDEIFQVVDDLFMVLKRAI